MVVVAGVVLAPMLAVGPRRALAAVAGGEDPEVYVAINQGSMSYTAQIEYYDYDATTLSPYAGGDATLYVYAELLDQDGSVLGWNVQSFAPSNSETSHSVTFEKFQDPSVSKTDVAFNASVLYYPSQEHTVSVSLYTTSPNYHLLHETLESWETAPNAELDGYRLFETDDASQEHTSTLRLQRWDGAQLIVDVGFGGGVKTEIAEGDGYWVRGSLVQQSGNTVYFAKRLVTDESNPLRFSRMRGATRGKPTQGHVVHGEGAGLLRAGVEGAGRPESDRVGRGKV